MKNSIFKNPNHLKLIIILNICAFFIIGCGGGGGDSPPYVEPNPPIVDTEFAKTQTTDNLGFTQFVYDTGSAEITTEDEYGNPLPGIDVDFWHKPKDADGKGGFELFAAKDPDGEYVFRLYPKAHNSTHILTGEFTEAWGTFPVVETYLIGTEDYEATNNLIKKISESVDCSNVTLSGLETILNTLSTGIFVGNGETIKNFVTRNLDELVKSGEIPELLSSNTYAVFIGIPEDVSEELDSSGILRNMKTIAVDNNKNGIPDYLEPSGPQPTCNDEDSDGFYAEGGDCGQVDCDDTNPDKYPGAPELCDGIDNQCPGDVGYGTIDEGCEPPPVPLEIIALTSRKTGTDQTFTVYSDGSGKKQLTFFGTNYSIYPSWLSPGRDRLVVVSDKNGENKFNPMELFILDIDNVNRVVTNVSQFTNNDFSDYMPAGSPDGTEIAYVTDEYGNPELVIKNSDGSGLPNRLTDNAVADYDPNWSPDKTKLAYSTRVVNIYQIRIMNPITKSEIDRIDSSYSDRRPAFSPDGKELAFDRFINGYSQIFVRDKNGIERQITFENYNHWKATWTKKDSSRIAMATDAAEWNIEEVNSSDGGDKIMVTTGSDINYEPVCRPQM